MNHLLDSALKHPIALLIVFLATIISVILAVLSYLRVETVIPQIPAEILQSVNSGPKLDIIDVDVSAESYQEELFWIIPLGERYLLSYDITINNNDPNSVKDCSIHSEYSGPGAEGQGILRVGYWYDLPTRDSPIYEFQIEGDSSIAEAFYSYPRERKIVPLDQLKVRVVCREPRVRISKWFPIETSKIIP